MNFNFNQMQLKVSEMNGRQVEGHGNQNNSL